MWSLNAEPNMKLKSHFQKLNKGVSFFNVEDLQRSVLGIFATTLGQQQH